MGRGSRVARTTSRRTCTWGPARRRRRPGDPPLTDSAACGRCNRAANDDLRQPLALRGRRLCGHGAGGRRCVRGTRAATRLPGNAVHAARRGSGFVESRVDGRAGHAADRLRQNVVCGAALPADGPSLAVRRHLLRAAFGRARRAGHDRGVRSGDGRHSARLPAEVGLGAGRGGLRRCVRATVVGRAQAVDELRRPLPSATASLARGTGADDRLPRDARGHRRPQARLVRHQFWRGCDAAAPRGRTAHRCGRALQRRGGRVPCRPASEHTTTCRA